MGNMKRFLGLLSLLPMFWMGNAHAAYVQGAGCDNAGGATTIVCTITASASGDTLAIIIQEVGQTISSVADNKSQTWTMLKTTNNTNLDTDAIYYFQNTASGVTTVTVTLAGSTDGAAIVVEESGVATSGNDGVNGAVVNTTTAYTSGSITTTNATDVVFGFAGTDTDTTFTVGSGYTAVTGTGITAGAHVNATASDTVFAERKTTSATGSQTGNMTAAASSSGGAFVLALKQSGGGGCTHSGITSAGAIATPNGTTGSYLGKTGAFVTPDCSTIQYWQPGVGNFGLTMNRTAPVPIWQRPVSLEAMAR